MVAKKAGFHKVNQVSTQTKFRHLACTWDIQMLRGSYQNVLKSLLIDFKSKIWVAFQNIDLTGVVISKYRGSPTYVVFATVDPTTAIFLLMYEQVGDFCVSRGPLQSH